MPVPVENRIGEEGEGFLIAMSAIDQGRFTVAAGAVGLAQACLDASVRYAHERHTFGQEIGEHQLVKQMIAKMAAGTEMGRLLVWRAAWLKNQGLRNTRETSLAKWHATEHAVQSRPRRHPGPRRQRLLERVPGRALPAQLEGRRHLRGDEPAPHAHPGRLRPRLSRGPAAALRAVAGPGLGAARVTARPAPRPPARGRAPARRCDRRRDRVLAAATAFGLWHVVVGGLVNGNPRARRRSGSALALAAGLAARSSRAWSCRRRRRRPALSRVRAAWPGSRRASWRCSAALAETFVRGDGERRAALAADALEQVADPSQLRQLRLVLRLMDSAAANLLLAGRPTRRSPRWPPTPASATCSAGRTRGSRSGARRSAPSASC